MRPYKKVYAQVCLLGLAVALLEMIPPRLVGSVVNQLASHQIEMEFIIEVAVLWLGICFTVQLMHSAQIKLASRSGEQILANLRRDLFFHLQQLSMGFYNRTHLGQIISRASNDLDSLRNILIWGLNTLFANTIIMICSTAMILMTEVDLFLSISWLIPTMILLNFFYGRKVTSAWKTVAFHSARVGANQAENIAGTRVVAAYNRQDENLVQYNELQLRNTRNNVLASKKSGAFQLWNQLVRFTGQIILLVYGGYRVARGTLAAGDLVAVTLYWEWVMNPAVNFGIFFNELLIASSGAQRVFELLDEIPEVTDEAGAVPLPDLLGHVEFEKVSFAYQGDKKVLNELNLKIPAGTVVALVGTTGSGKSTFLSLLARFHQPTSGRVLIDGYDLRKIQGRSLQKQLAMVLQSNYLFPGTILENLRYVRPDASDQEIHAAAISLGCHEKFLSLKNGYLTQVGERGSSLSIGEKQLVCFTRALVANPRIILLDEATSAIDPVTETQVQIALNKLIRGRTTFIVAHRLSTIVCADLILVMDQGRIIEKGRHSDLISMNGKYAQLHAHNDLDRYTHCLS